MEKPAKSSGADQSAGLSQASHGLWAIAIVEREGERRYAACIIQQDGVGGGKKKKKSQVTKTEKIREGVKNQRAEKREQ